MRRARTAWTAAFLTVMALAFSSALMQSSTAHAGTGKTTICHATGSAKNPYVRIRVSNSSLDHHRTHQGGKDEIPAPDDRNCGEPAPEPTPDVVPDTGTPVDDVVDDITDILGDILGDGGEVTEDASDTAGEVTEPVMEPIDDLCVLLGCTGPIIF